MCYLSGRSGGCDLGGRQEGSDLHGGSDTCNICCRSKRFYLVAAQEDMIQVVQ